MQTTLRTARLAEWITTGLVAVVAVFGIMGHWVSFPGEPLRLVAKLYFFSMEALFWHARTGEAIVAISVLVLGLALLSRVDTGRLAAKLEPHHALLVRRGYWGLLALPVLVAQVYLVAFATRAQPLWFGVLLSGAAGFELAARRKTEQRAGVAPSLAAVPVQHLVLLLATYLFLGMVVGHLATPLVHAAAAAQAAISRSSDLEYKLSIAILLLLPMSMLIHRVACRVERWWWAGVLVGLIGVLFACPVTVATYGFSVIVAGLTILALQQDGFRAIGLLHPSPRLLAARLLVLSLLALNAVTVHYALAVWRCPRDLPPGVRLLTTEPGTFDLATLRGGSELLVSLREPRQVLLLDVATGNVVERVVTSGWIESTGSVFSWVEPENLLAVEGATLLLLAVSDDENANRIVALGEDLRPERLVEGIRDTSISDMVTDAAGRLFVSTEFEEQVYVLAQESLAVTGALVWPEAETNKILGVAESDRLYSLGLWSDRRLRAVDLRTGTEIATLDVGTHSWDMAYDPEQDRLFVPKLLSGDVLVVDAASLSLVDRWPAGFGARPVEVDPIRRLLYVGNMYDGRVRVFDLDTGDSVLDTRLGGYIKGLTVDPTTHKAYTGCACGVFEIAL